MGGGSFLSEFRRLGCLRSLRAHLALDGISWAQGGSVEIAVGRQDRMPQNPRRHLLPSRGREPAQIAPEQTFDTLLGLVEQVSDPGRERSRSERFVDKIDTGIEPPVVDNGVASVSGRE
jgi:hypothetical protein